MKSQVTKKIMYLFTSSLKEGNISWLVEKANWENQMKEIAGWGAENVLSDTLSLTVSAVEVYRDDEEVYINTKALIHVHTRFLPPDLVSDPTIGIKKTE